MVLDSATRNLKLGNFAEDWALIWVFVEDLK